MAKRQEDKFVTFDRDVAEPPVLKRLRIEFLRKNEIIDIEVNFNSWMLEN